MSRVKCAVRLTDDDGTHAEVNPRLSLNRGLANWGVNPRRWNRPLMFHIAAHRVTYMSQILVMHRIFNTN